MRHFAGLLCSIAVLVLLGSARPAGAAPGAPSAGAGPSSGPIDASITIGTVQFGNPDDKAEFEALLRRHSKEIAEIMDYETRRRDRLRF